MGYENKYGRITTERGDIPDTEPVFLFRAQDAVLPDLLVEYRRLCRVAGSPPDHLLWIDEAILEITGWQEHNGARVPTSSRVREWAAGDPDGT